MKFSTFLIALLLPVTAFAGCVDFPRDLKLGMSGNDVFVMQKILNSDSATIIASSGPGSPGHEDDLFSAKTLLAVQAFQKLYATELLPDATSSTSTPTGVVTLPTRTKLSRLSCEIDVSRPVVATTTPTQLGSGLCPAIKLAPLPRPKVVLDEPTTYRVRRGDLFSLYGKNFTDNNTVDIGNKSICFTVGADGGRRIDITIPLDAALGEQYVRVTNKYGQSNLIKIIILEASPHDQWSGGCVNITRTLSLQSKGADVKTLQRFLNSDTRTQITADGVESYGKETDLFSPITKNGVMSFQKLYAADVLRPAKLITPTGVIGQLAAKKIRELTNCPALNAPTGRIVGAPTLSSIQPNAAAEGDDIVLRGTNFTGENTILFGNSAFGPYGSADGRSIVITLTSFITPGKMPVYVRTANGRSRAVEFTMLATSTIGKVPHIDWISPSHAKPGTAITLSGVGFTPTDNVLTGVGSSGFAKVALPSFSWGKQIALTIAKSMKPGAINFQITNANGVSNTRSFIVDPERVIAPPVIERINPGTAKQGTMVIIEGRNFVDPSTVFIDGATFNDVHIGSERSISLMVPMTMSVGAHEIRVKNPVATSNTKTLTVIDKNADVPVLDSITPSTAASGDTVVLTGKNLAGNDLVYFGDTLVSTVYGVGDGTKASLYVRNLEPKEYKLHIQNRGGVSNELSFTIYKDEKPHITTLYPDEVYPGDTIKISGRNLSGGWVVMDGKTFAAIDATSLGTNISSVIPDDTAAGTYTLHVSTDKGNSNDVSLNVLPAKTQKLTSVSPNPTYTGMTVYVRGEALGSSVDVHIGSAVIPGLSVSGGTSVNVPLPSSIGVGTYDVWATSPRGDTNKLSLDVRDATGGGGTGGGSGGLLKPIIYSLSPNKVDRVKCLTNGVHFTISGANFATSSENVIRSGIGGEQRMVSKDGRTLYFDAGGGLSMALPCTKPAMNPTNDLDIYVYVQNAFGTSEGKIFTVKGIDPLSSPF